jgi:hypothetical protein
MKRKYFPFSSFARRFGLSRRETGVGVIELLVVTAMGVALAAIALTEVRRSLPAIAQKKLDAIVAALQADQAAINTEIARQQADNIQNPTLPADSEPIVNAKQHIQQAKDLLNANSSLVKPEILDQINKLVADTSSCQITKPNGPVEATVGKPITINIVARIPLNDPNATGSIKSSNSADVDEPISRDKGITWSGDITLLGKKEDVQDGSTTTITVTASTSGDSPVTCTSTNSVTVKWKAVKPVIKSFTANPDKVKPLDPLETNHFTSFHWETTDADTVSIDPDVGAVSPAGNGTKLYAPQQTKSYTLTAKGPGGEVTSDPVTVTVVKKPVITSFGANPPVIAPGQSSALFWSIDDADRASIDQGVGSVNPSSGSGLSVSPQQTTTYTLTASGPGGDADPKSVTVLVKPVITSFSVNPDEIAPGQSATLSWVITGATSASIDQGVGAVDPKSGSIPVSPTQKTTYTLTASGSGGSADPKSVTVRVEAKPQTYTITLESSGGGNLATTDTVTVDGTVSPAPPAGTVVALGVNGASVGTVSVDSSGFFVAVVPLKNKTTLADLVLFNDDVFISSCGGAAAPIDLWNSTTQAKTQNSIEAAVVAQGGGQASNIASVVFFHGVRVIDAEVVWGGECPGPYADYGGGEVLGPGDVVTVAYAECGVPCAAVGSGVFCTATANANVTTTAGELSADALWTVSISP